MTGFFVSRNISPTGTFYQWSADLIGVGFVPSTNRPDAFYFFFLFFSIENAAAATDLKKPSTGTAGALPLHFMHREHGASSVHDNPIVVNLKVRRT